MKIYFFILCIVSTQLFGQGVETCRAELNDDTLIVENQLIARKFFWNNGNIITRSLTDKTSGHVWQTKTAKPDLAFPGQSEKAENGKFSSRIVSENAVAPAHLEVEITYMLEKLEVKRIFRLYPNCAVIACDLYFRGSSTAVWLQPGTNLADMVNLEKLTGSAAGSNTPVIEKLELPGKHWKLNAVEFFDITDRFNNLVSKVDAMSYRPNLYRGNLLFAHDNVTDNGLFILKEAPTSNVQLAYPGGDFLTEFGKLSIIGAGLNPSDLHPTEWRRGYGFATGVYSGDEKNRDKTLRLYQRNLRIHKPGRDEMVLMNTWGDRGQDTRVREKFALTELEVGAKLGITHFQVDDGWQTGRSSNSALKGGSLSNIWQNKNYWEPSPEKFPNGLEPVVKKGKELGIEVCLWFNPSKDNSNEHWEKDADALIGIYKKYGIRTFKIDGVSLPDKLAEINFRKFLDKVSQESNHNVVFNLDVTAGRRGGYHYLNEYGNIFLENRYTDWANYYPYTTLRNLWMLSGYVPAQNFQIEFLNKWRNEDKYLSNDPFAPKNYTFDYLFAITMFAQPLAWFEGTGLPPEAFSTSRLVKTYLKHNTRIHSGQIFPIGNQPDGTQWTGFQSILNDREGYIVVFREDNEQVKGNIKTWFSVDAKVVFTPIAGSGKAFQSQVLKDGTVEFTLPVKNSFGLYSYKVN
ncbi:alpha-galactosidase [Dyadobacter sp. 3J3]|uniref:alpha-galactosidase n=1 Tax=Dyadobacter sp. 3J3 TaxID=2606600 RepID=UPI00135A92BE|nr:alpha-galactosidase [Dyadobacter sp. 3J3]